jgi:hypothetical protein
MGSATRERGLPSVADRLRLREWVADYPEWAIQVACRRCIHVVVLHPKKIRHPRVRRMGDLKARLVCGECGSWDFSLRPYYLAKGWTVP